MRDAIIRFLTKPTPRQYRWYYLVLLVGTGIIQPAWHHFIGHEVLGWPHALASGLFLILGIGLFISLRRNDPGRKINPLRQILILGHLALDRFVDHSPSGAGFFLICTVIGFLASVGMAIGRQPGWWVGVFIGALVGLMCYGYCAAHKEEWARLRQYH